MFAGTWAPYSFGGSRPRVEFQVDGGSGVGPLEPPFPTFPYAPAKFVWTRCETLMDCVDQLKKGHASDTDDLRQKQRSHMETHAAVYGVDHLKPKWHKSLHLPDQIDRDDGLVLDTQTNERDHQGVKAFGDQIKNLDRFELDVIVRSLSLQLQKLEKFSLHPRLTSTEYWSEDLQAYVAQELYCRGLRVSCTDLVYERSDALTPIEVKACGSDGEGNLFIVADVLEVLQQSPLYQVARKQRSLEIVWILGNDSVIPAKCWKRLDAERYCVIRPLL